MKCIPIITRGRPVLDEETFQRLLAAAHILQECNDGERQKFMVGYPGRSGGTIAHNAPVQTAPLTPQAAEVPIPNRPQGQLIVKAGVEPLAPQSNGIISPETARPFRILASQLEALNHQVRRDSEWPRLPAALETEIPGYEVIADQTGARFEQPQSGSTQVVPLGDVPSGRSYWPHRIVRRRVSQGNEFFWTTATMFAVAAFLFLLLGASIHTLSPFPGGVSPSAEVVQQQTPFPRTITTESSPTKSAEPLVLSDQPPARAANSGSSEKRVVKSDSRHSTFGSEAHLVAEENARVASEIENRIRADRRLPMTRVQVRVSNGIVTLFGNVASDAERVAAAQDAGRIGGVEALVNKLQVITKPQSPTLQKPSASVAPILGGPVAESSKAEAISSSASRGTMANTHSTNSKVLGASSSSSPVSTSATPFSETEQITLPYGTVLAVRLTETLSSDFNQRGDTFLANLASPIVIGDRVIVPEGASVKGKIVDARNAKRFRGKSTLVVEVTHLTYNGRTYELRSSQYSKQGASRNAYAAAATTGGAGVGAIIGTVLGRGKGAAIGATLGAVAGTGVQAVTKPASVELSAESVLSLPLETSLKVIRSSTLQRVQSAGPDFSQDSLSSDDRPVLKNRAGSPLPETNTNTPEASPTSNKGSQQAPPPRHN